MFKLYKVEVSLPQWKYRSSKASIEVAPVTSVQVALTQYVELSIDKLLSEPSTKDKCIKENVLEQRNEVTIEDGGPQAEQQEQMEFLFYSLMEPSAETHHPNDSVVEFTAEEEEEGEEWSEGSLATFFCHPQEETQFERKGEGWLPFPKNSLTNAMFFYDESDEDASHLYEELLCSQSSIDAASEKIKVTSYSSDEEESLGQSLFGFGDDLEMVNTSNSTWKDSEALEMCDSSRPVVVHEDFAGLWDNMSPAVNKFLQGCIITCYALQSLSLYGLKQEEPESQIKEEGEGWMPICKIPKF